MCRTKFGSFVAAGALLGLGSGAVAQQGGMARKTTPMTNQVTSIDTRFMTKAAQGNIAEVLTSQLALKKSNNAGVREVADMLIKEHSKANDDLKQVAAKNNFRLPSQPNALQKAMYNKLSRLDGAAFDKAYMKDQIKSHLDTITLFQMEMGSGRDAEAVLFAREYLPGIQNHTSMIVDTAQSVGVPIPVAGRPYLKKQTAGMMKKM